MRFEEQHKAYMARCEKALHDVTKHFFTPLSVVSKAAEYSLLNGGKRVRGVLTLAVCDLLDGDFHAADVFSAAVEMIHSFSLIHDDLPCMDDDDMRRGKPANHIVYGEANALLAGDLLAIEAFEIIASASFSSELRAKAISTLAAGAGARGMIYGQELDMENENKQPDEAALCAIHRNKTGALLLAAARLGEVAAACEPEDASPVSIYAKNIGLVFQIVDDILDVTSSKELLGKPVGSDKQQHKASFITVVGLEESRRQVQRLTQEAVTVLQQKYGDKSTFLCEFATTLAARVR